MNEEQLKIIQTVILLLDNGEREILFNNLMPHMEKAKKIKDIINK